MQELEIAKVAAITAIVYVIGLGIKVSGIPDKFIPLICGLCGMLLGIAAMWLMPDYPAGDIITSAAIGAVSGFSATGINQLFKQLGSGE